MSVHGMCAVAERASGPLGLGLQVVVSSRHKSNLNPLMTKAILLTTDPSLQALYLTFLEYIYLFIFMCRCMFGYANAIMYV